MDNILYDILIKRYNTVLNDLQIGYSLDNNRISDLWRLIQTLDCLEHTSFSNKEIRKIISYYE